MARKEEDFTGIPSDSFTHDIGQLVRPDLLFFYCQPLEFKSFCKFSIDKG